MSGNWDRGLPDNIDRLCVGTISNAPKDEPIQVYCQSGFARAPQAEKSFKDSFNIIKSLYCDDPNEV